MPYYSLRRSSTPGPRIDISCGLSWPKGNADRHPDAVSQTRHRTPVRVIQDNSLTASGRPGSHLGYSNKHRLRAPGLVEHGRSSKCVGTVTVTASGRKRFAGRQREFHLDNVRWLPHRAQARNNPRGRTRDTVRLTCPLGVRVALPREMKIRNEGIELSACGP